MPSREKSIWRDYLGPDSLALSVTRTHTHIYIPTAFPAFSALLLGQHPMMKKVYIYIYIKKLLKSRWCDICCVLCQINLFSSYYYCPKANKHTNDLIKYSHAHNLHLYHGFTCFMDIVSTDRDQTHKKKRILLPLRLRRSQPPPNIVGGGGGKRFKCNRINRAWAVSDTK